MTVTLHYHTIHYITLPNIILHCSTLPSLPGITRHCTILRYTKHYIALRHITLHPIAFSHLEQQPHHVRVALRRDRHERRRPHIVGRVTRVVALRVVARAVARIAVMRLARRRPRLVSGAGGRGARCISASSMK